MTMPRQTNSELFIRGQQLGTELLHDDFAYAAIIEACRLFPLPTLLDDVILFDDFCNAFLAR
jgi:hypothetical protein